MGTKITALEQEVSLIKSFVIGLAGKDREGVYRPRFVKRVLRALSGEPKYRFSSPANFLNSVKCKK